MLRRDRPQVVAEVDAEELQACRAGQVWLLPFRTNWTRLVPPPVLIGRVSAPAAQTAPRAGTVSALLAAEGYACVHALQVPPPSPRTKWTRRVPHPVLTGHVSCVHALQDSSLHFVPVDLG